MYYRNFDMVAVIGDSQGIYFVGGIGIITSHVVVMFEYLLESANGCLLFELGCCDCLRRAVVRRDDGAASFSDRAVGCLLTCFHQVPIQRGKLLLWRAASFLAQPHSLSMSIESILLSGL